MTEEHGARAHAKYSGSKISLIRKCPGQARQARVLGRSWGDSPDAAEGTIVHELIEIAIVEGLDRALEYSQWTEERGVGVLLTLNYVDGLRKLYPDIHVYSEMQVFFPQNVVPVEDCAGLADIVCFSATARRGWLIDYKNGVQEVPHPSVNDQLWFYATAAFWHHLLEDFTTVIIQPNAFGVEPIREHTAPFYELIAFQAEIESLLRSCEEPDAPLTAGPWCGNCSVGAECQAREKAALAALTGDPDIARENLVAALPKPGALDISRLAELKSISGFVRKWLADVDAAAYAYAMQGGTVPGFKVVQAAGKREWIGTPEETAEGLSAITGRPTSAFLKTVPVGITEAEKQVQIAASRSPDPDGLKAKFALLAVKTTSDSLSLVPDTDKRAAYNAAANAFMGVVPDTLIAAG